MSSNIVNPAPFIQTSREFPQDAQQLSVELSKTYIEIASNINSRTVGLFPTIRSAQNGEAWVIVGNRRQSAFRQVYQCDDAHLLIDHGLNFISIANFVRIWGTFFDGTNWQSLPYVDVTNANNQINVKVNSTQIVITKGGGSPPSVSQGLIVIEWVVNP